VPRLPVRLVGFAAFLAFVALFIAGFFHMKWWLPLGGWLVAVAIPISADRVLPYRVRPALAVFLAGFGAFAAYLWIVELNRFASSSVTQGETAWIVLTFTVPDGTEAQLSFDNPEVASISLADCEKLLPTRRDSLVKSAREAAPILRDAAFKSATCVMSKDDPIKPKMG
jgi:hypothetical protein